jgi:hypothetical protein
MDFYWDAIESADDLDEAFVALEKRKPQIFTGKKHGTLFEVTDLREIWSRGELRRLYRSVNSLCSPFQGPTDFEVTLSAPGKEEWLKGMFSAEDANKCAVYHVRGAFEGTSAFFDYDFTPPERYSKQLSRRHKKLADIKLGKKDGRAVVPVDLSKHHIGKVDFDFSLFDAILPFLVRSQAISKVSKTTSMKMAVSKYIAMVSRFMISASRAMTG